MIPIATAIAYALQLSEATRSIITLVNDANNSGSKEISTEAFAQARSGTQSAIDSLDRAIAQRKLEDEVTAARLAELSKHDSAFDPPSKRV